jgi:two-component system chemotaxis sensor kinase CheA
MVGTQQMEMLDPFALFAEAARGVADAAPARPVHCLIADSDDAWLSGILAPLLRQAGHEVTIGTTGEITPDIILSSDPSGIAADGGVPVLALSDDADAAVDGAIYRYDRDRILARIADLTARRAA